MMSLVLVVSSLVALGALGVLAGALVPLVAEVRRTTRDGAESVARIRRTVAGIREEEERLRHNLTLMSESAAAWPRAAVLPREAGVLITYVRALGVAVAFLSTLRRAPWKVVEKLVAGR